MAARDERVCAMPIAIKPTHRFSDDEIDQLSRENPGYQFERDRAGRLVVTPAGGEGGRRSAEVLAQLRNWARENNAGPVFDSSTGFALHDGSLLSPDAAWVHTERWAALSQEQREAFPPLCPDAVFEVRSRSDSPSDVTAKLRAYMENGARVAVAIDPYRRKVEVRRWDGSSRIVDYDLVDLSADLSGFTLDLWAVN
jgi:Uma2 family endonuclease